MEGNDMDAVLEGLRNAKSLLGKEKPVVILMKTGMGHGIDFMVGSHEWHGIAPNDEQLGKALEQLPIPRTFADY
jgi:transketolase